LPHLQKKSPSDLLFLLCDLGEKARKLQTRIESQVETLGKDTAEFAENSAVINAMKFKNLHRLVQIQLINKSLDKLKISQRDIKKIHYQNIIRLANNCRTGRKIQLPRNFSVTCRYGNLVFSKDSKQAHTDFEFQIPIGQKVTYKNLTIASKVFPSKQVQHAASKPGKDKFTEWFDLDKLKLPLLLSTPKQGQRFVPLGQSNEKKISRFFIDAKISHPKRRNSLVISDSEKVIWLWPFRISDNVKTTPQTKTILELQITPTCEKTDESSPENSSLES
jgi:tRNA(Ile)-lysidine synthase